MKILVINGSPKGKFSVTLQTSLYLQKRFPNEEYKVLHAGQKIKAYEKDFKEARIALLEADLLIFSYPVYTFLAPYQLHRFIELMKADRVDLKGKVATQITTSKHFFDVTAHKYIEENCYDMGLKYLPGLSADMEDLREKKGREMADCFFEKTLFDIEQGIYKEREVTEKRFVKPYEMTLENVEKKSGKNVVIVTNYHEEDVNLQHMIEDFQRTFPYESRIINIREFPFTGGCLGCLSCATTAKCIYKDHFDEFLREEIQTADAIIYAFTIENHYTHSSFKCYDDRQFCNGHRSVTTGMPVGYLISGEYEKEYNVQTLVEGRSEVGGVYLAGVATDEKDTGKEIKKLANSLAYTLEHTMIKPMNFYGTGGTKIFRDLVYLMQGMMKADHKYYKDHGIYDFPQNQKMKILQMKLIGTMISHPAAQKKMKGKMSQYIIAPYSKIIEEAKEK